jgi:hypothetical protein
MPAFHEIADERETNKLTQRELALIVDWLRRDTDRAERTADRENNGAAGN